MHLVACGINHHTAPVEVRERLAFGKAELPRVIGEVRSLPGVRGCVVLATCNRTEVYAAVSEAGSGAEVLAAYLRGKAGLDGEKVAHHLRFWTCYEAVRHLFRVAAGLDSMVLGETEILGQVRDAYEEALRHGATNRVLNTLFQEAVRVGKRVRSTTGIDQHPASVSYAAVALAERELGGLAGATALIIGAGEMGELTLKHLLSRGVQAVLVSNRSFARAQELARVYGGEAVSFEELEEHLRRADVVVSCTAASHFVLTRAKVEKALAGRDPRPLFLIDIAVPRDVEPAVRELPGVILYDIDDLAGVVLQHTEERRRAAAEGERLVEEAVAEFSRWLATLSVVPVIKALQRRGEELKEAEVEKCLRRLGNVDARTERLVRALAHALVQKLFHAPIANLKERALGPEGHLYGEVLRQLFDLEIPAEDRELLSWAAAWEKAATKVAGEARG